MNKSIKQWLQPDHLVTGEALESLFLKRVKPTKHDRSGFFRVTKPFKVFKKAEAFEKRTKHVILALVIPEGAFIYAPSLAFTEANLSRWMNRKMRASEVRLDSAWTLAGKKVAKKHDIASFYDTSFKYKHGRPILPHRFAITASSCSGGIHFFMNFADAYNYVP